LPRQKFARPDTTGSGRIPGVDDEEPRKWWIGSSKVVMSILRPIGLVLLATIVLPWLPVLGPQHDATPARRVRSVGSAAIWRFAFAPDSQTIATIHTDGSAALLDAGARYSVPYSLGYPGQAQVLAFSPDGRSLAVGGLGLDIHLYNPSAGGEGHPLGMPIRDVNALAFSADGRTLAASSYLHHDILLWDVAAGHELLRLQGHESSVNCLAFAPDGRSLASGSMNDPVIFVWDLATRRPLRRLEAHPGGIYSLAFSPDGGWLASTAYEDRPVRLWDLAGGRADRLIGVHSLARDAVAFSPDGRMLATTGDDGVVRLWNLTSGAELGHVGGPTDRLTHVAFSPDGRMLAATALDADVRLWDVSKILPAQRREPSGGPTGERATSSRATATIPSRPAMATTGS
jgi:WD40 repeat protein